jgi:hypothetical protein
MRIGLLCPLLLMTACPAKEWKVAIQDEGGRGLAGAQLEAVLTPPDDPRLSSVITRTGQTDADGGFRFMAEDRMVLTRVKAKRAGYHSADADHRHGFGRADMASDIRLTMPADGERVALHYREVSLSGLPNETWIGFDAEAIDAIAPWGKGKVADFNLRISSRQVGWTESDASLAALRRTPEGARMDEREWAQSYGRFEGTLNLSFPRAGDGILTTPAFWPYCLLKMPALAPGEVYVSERALPFDTVADSDPAHDFTGYYLRLRAQLDAGGRITAAHYAKIHGRIGVGPGRVKFRFYYNPQTDDRRLALAPGRNLLRPSGPGEPAHVFETQQP